MADRKELGRITIITDDSTGMYRIGEVDGGFHHDRLREHISEYGDTDILRLLAYMTSKVIGISRDINAENQTHAFSAESNIKVKI